jgi:hypothetical protein
MDTNSTMAICVAVVGLVVVTVVRAGGRFRLRHDGTEVEAEKLFGPEEPKLRASASITDSRVGRNAVVETTDGPAAIDGSTVGGDAIVRAGQAPKA